MRIRKVSCADFFSTRPDREYPHWIYVDFRSVSPQENPLDIIYEAVFNYIKVDSFFRDYERAVRPAYHDDIESLKSGPLALIARDKANFDQKVSALLEADFHQKKPYVDKLVGYAARRQPVYLVVDNVDQYESEAHQAKVFADAIAIASRLRVNLVLPMRETTFVRHRGKPIFATHSILTMFILSRRKFRPSFRGVSYIYRRCWKGRREVSPR